MWPLVMLLLFESISSLGSEVLVISKKGRLKKNLCKDSLLPLFLLPAHKDGGGTTSWPLPIKAPKEKIGCQVSRASGSQVCSLNL